MQQILIIIIIIITQFDADESHEFAYATRAVCVSDARGRERCAPVNACTSTEHESRDLHEALPIARVARATRLS